MGQNGRMEGRLIIKHKHTKPPSTPFSDFSGFGDSQPPLPKELDRSDRDRGVSADTTSQGLRLTFSS